MNMKTPAGQSMASVEYDMTQRIVNRPNSVETKLINLIKQIQLDAYKAGMSEAAVLLRSRMVPGIELSIAQTRRNVTLDEGARDVLSARDRKTSL